MGLKDWIRGRVQALDDAAQPWAARNGTEPPRAAEAAQARL